MSYQDHIYTIYDAMARKGLFRVNPANRDSVGEGNRPLYKGPVQFPKMFYHPKGLERVTRPAEIIATPMGPRKVGEQRELISKLAENAKEGAVLAKLGWHDHPAKAIAASGRKAPPMASKESVQTLEAQMADLAARLAAAKSAQEADSVLEHEIEELEADNALNALSPGDGLGDELSEEEQLAALS